MKDELIQIHGTNSNKIYGRLRLSNGTMLAVYQIFGEIINIGNDEELSVIDTLWLIGKLMKIPKTKIKLEFLSEKEVFGDYKDISEESQIFLKQKNF